MKQNQELNRRQWLGHAAGAAALLVAQSRPGNKPPANVERLRGKRE